MRIGSLVNWTKRTNMHPDSETVVLPAIVNQIWEETDGRIKNVGLFVFSFEGQFLSRVTPVDQIEVIADPQSLAGALAAVPGILKSQFQQDKDIQELKFRLSALEGSLGVTDPQAKASVTQVIPPTEDHPAVFKSGHKLVAGKGMKES